MYTTMKRITVLLLCFLSLSVFSQVSIIPKPNEVVMKKGHFRLNENTLIIAPREIKFEGYWLKTALQKHYNLSLKQTPNLSAESNFIQLQIVKGGNASAYELNILENEIQITSVDAAGIFHGIQSLFQLIVSSNNFQLPCAVIRDEPRFAWRGMHLDCCRHFFSVEEVKKYIDYLAMYKMNIFHWHLTDDQGWRIEIKRYPELTAIGAWRQGSMVGHYKDQQWDTLRYGGFYTQNQIREIVSYASERHITVVPEIEMPGHALAALAAFPEYSCTRGPFKVGNTWGVFDEVFCAGNDSTFLFLQNILDEVIELFPGEYIHIGGDECPKTEWKTCAKCQSRIKAENLKDEHELQSYFIQRIEKYLNSKGRKIIGWDEILEGGLAPNAAVMSWRGTEGGLAAAKQKHFAVMSPGSPCYFDHYQFKDQSKQPIAIGGYNPLEMVYAYEPVPKTLTAEESAYIMGAQANIWTEYITTFDHVEYMALPRMAALSEVLWTPPKNKDYKDFLLRLQKNYVLLTKMGVNYAKEKN